MGNWNIHIAGIGVHHNTDLDEDANKMAHEFVKKLKAAGHTIIDAEFHYGDADDLNPDDGE
jgi:hypothetical protein